MARTMGFFQDTRTRNVTFMIKVLSEQAIEVHKNLYLRFIDYTKLSNKVQHRELLEILRKLDLPGKD